jgi:hypothetical protein
MSLISPVRSFGEPRPKVVGIAWVVECVEQKTLVDEAKFSVNLEGMNIVGLNKVINVSRPTFPRSPFV